MIENKIDFFLCGRENIRFWRKSDSVYFKFGRKVNRRKTERYNFGGNVSRPQLLYDYWLKKSV